MTLSDIIESIKYKYPAKMTIDEAIEHCEDVAACNPDQCGEEHAQLAEWLKELKERRTRT